MTPSQVETAARNRYGASTDSFFSQSEIFDLIFQAEMILATQTFCIEGVDSSTTTVSGTQSYAFPTNFIGVKRVEWNGRRLKKYDFREDDLVTALAANTTTTGDPTYYFIWNGTIYLREIPGSAQTLKVWGYKQPTALSTSPISTSLSVPVRHHPKLINYVTSHIAAKDKDYEGSRYYLELWEQDVKRAEAEEKRLKRADQFSYVRTEEQMQTTEFGV